MQKNTPTIKFRFNIIKIQIPVYVSKFTVFNDFVDIWFRTTQSMAVTFDVKLG